MVAIGEHNGRRTAALITDMDVPLGHLVGNSLEVQEAAETLMGKGPQDLLLVCKALASNILVLAGKGTGAQCEAMVEQALASGAALEKLCLMVQAQGGDAGYIRAPHTLPRAKYEKQVLCEEEGYLCSMDTEKIGISAVLLGAGRETKESTIDPAAGLRIEKKTGDPVAPGDVLAVLYAEDEAKFAAAEAEYRSALTFGPKAPAPIPLVYALVEKDKVTML